MSASVQEDAVPYPVSGQGGAGNIASKVAGMTQEERWAFYATDEFAVALTQRFHRAKIKALTSGVEFYQSR